MIYFRVATSEQIGEDNDKKNERDARITGKYDKGEIRKAESWAGRKNERYSRKRKHMTRDDKL